MLPLLAGIGSLMGTIGTGMEIAKGIGGFFGQGDKVIGVPTPESAPVPKPMSGPESGADYLGFMDQAFPGTSPWERLGASTGSYPGASLGASSQQGMQAREFRQQKLLTEMNNRASIISASSPMGAVARDSNLMRYMLGFGGDYDSKVAQDREMMPVHKSNVMSGTSMNRQRTRNLRAEQDVVESEAIHAKAGRPYADLRAFFDTIGAGTGAMLPIGISKFLGNRGIAPRRFQMNDEETRLHDAGKRGYENYKNRGNYDY